MAVYKGTAYANQTAGGGTGSRFLACRLGSADTNPQSNEDGPAFDVVASTAPLVFYLTQSTIGVSPPSVPDTITVRLYHAETTTVAATVTVAGNAATASLYLTSDGTATGTPLIGDYRLGVSMFKDTGIGTWNEDSEIDNLKGFIRASPASMTVQAEHSGASDPASYDDNIEVTIDLSHSPGVERSHRHFDVSVLDATDGVTVYATSRTAGTDPQNAIIRVDNRFPATQVSAHVDIKVVAVPSTIAPNSDPTLTWIAIPASTADFVNATQVRKGPIPVDATIRVQHHLQVNDSVYDPAKAVTAMLASDLGFITAKVVNARFEPLGGITYHSTLRDENNLLPAAIDQVVTTDATGFPPTMAVWDSTKPGGAWCHKVIITAPADAVGLDFDTEENRALLSANPALSLVTGCGPSSANTDERHLEPGMEVLVGLTIVDVFTGLAVSVDDGTATAAVARFNLTYGRAEFLDSDMVWKTVSGNTVYFWPLSPSPGDASTYVRVFSIADTTVWGVSDLFIVGRANVAGVPLTNFMKEVVVSGVNNHSQYKFDGAGFLGFPTR